MKLNEFIERIDDDTVMFIGSKISFFFIGTKKRWHELSDRIYEQHKSRLESVFAKANTEKLKDRYTEELKAMIPFGEREVMESYAHQSEPGINVRIKGNEHGRYWFLSEFEKNYGKEK